MGHERRLEILFYLIIAKIRIYRIETPEIKRLFSLFTEEMSSQIHSNLHIDFPSSRLRKISFLKKYFSIIEKKLALLQNKVRTNQIKAFLSVCEYYIHTLEQFYKDISQSDRVLELYIIRMDIRRHSLFFERKIGGWAGFSFFRLISNYGTSFGRLALTCTVSILLFGGIYWLADYFAPADLRMIHDLSDISSYLFNSLVTISGLGIDSSPVTALQRIAMGINTIYGMVVFGMLFNVISTKLSMNS